MVLVFCTTEEEFKSCIIKKLIIESSNSIVIGSIGYGLLFNLATWYSRRSLYWAGSVLSGGGSVPAENAAAGTWIDMVNGFQKGAMSTRLGIPIIYGIDALHGNNNVYNATIFPHNIGLGATRQVHTSIIYDLTKRVHMNMPFTLFNTFFTHPYTFFKHFHMVSTLTIAQWVIFSSFLDYIAKETAYIVRKTL